MDTYTSDRDSNFLIFLLRTCTQNVNMLQTRFMINSKFIGFLGTDLDGTIFSKYIAVYRAYTQNDMGNKA